MGNSLSIGGFQAPQTFDKRDLDKDGKISREDFLRRTDPSAASELRKVEAAGLIGECWSKFDEMMAQYDNEKVTG